MINKLPNNFSNFNSVYYWVNTSREKINNSINYKIRELQAKSKELAKFPEPEQSYFEQASLLENNFFVVDKTGKIINTNNFYKEIIFPQEMQNHILSDGYYIFDSVLNDDAKKITIVPINGNYFLINIMKKDDYIKFITKDITMPENYSVEYTGNSDLYLENSEQLLFASKSVNDHFIGQNFENIVSVELSDKNFHIMAFIKPSLSDNFYSLESIYAFMIAFIVTFAIYIFCLFNEIFQTKKRKNEIKEINKKDSLTGLNNISFLDTDFKNIIKNQNDNYSFICLDIVSFQRFNMNYGFKKGNLLLVSISDALKEAFGNAIRTYGDIFAFVLKDSENDLESIKIALYKSIEKNLGYNYKGQVLFKFGIYPIKNKNESVWYMYDQAMLALKLAKEQSKFNDNITIDNSIQKKMEYKKLIEENMHSALHNDEFILYIQPKCSLDSGLCSGGEALVRWNSKDLGFITPDKFISLFEKNGFISDLDLYVLETVLKIQQEHFNSGLDILPISVNQSKVTITSPYYLEKVGKLIKSFRFPLNYIEIEVTESSLESDSENVMSVMYSLRDMGFLVDMDDFGSGFSSLNTLKDLPVDILKIDRGFLKESDSCNKSLMIIKHIINMTKELDIIVVCEGVETEKQFEFLKVSGCDYVQGYYYSKPIPLKDYENNYIYKLKSN